MDLMVVQLFPINFPMGIGKKTIKYTVGNVIFPANLQTLTFYRLHTRYRVLLSRFTYLLAFWGSLINRIPVRSESAECPVFGQKVEETAYEKLNFFADSCAYQPPVIIVCTFEIMRCTNKRNYSPDLSVYLGMLRKPARALVFPPFMQLVKNTSSSSSSCF